MNSDFKELLSLLNAHGVRYLIVGGYAVMHYTEPRFTKDLDIWVGADNDNALRVFRALAEFGAPLKGLSADDFAKTGFFYQLGRPPIRVDILMSIDGVGFEEAWTRRQQGTMAEQLVSFIGKADLIQNKRTSGRHIDLHDAEMLDRN